VNGNYRDMESEGKGDGQWTPTRAKAQDTQQLGKSSSEEVSGHSTPTGAEPMHGAMDGWILYVLIYIHTHIIHSLHRK